MTKEEQRAYSRGYQAGMRRKKKDIDADRQIKEENAFRDRAFLAALPACITAERWVRGEKPIKSLQERVRLAWDASDEAVRQRRLKP